MNLAPHLQYLTVQQAAAVSGYSPRALDNMRHRQAGPPWLRVGKRAIRYRLDVLLKWLEQSHHQ
jgi:hypothetical protein